MPAPNILPELTRELRPVEWLPLDLDDPVVPVAEERLLEMLAEGFEPELALAANGGLPQSSQNPSTIFP